MANHSKSSNSIDEIDFVQLFKILAEYKKILILSILFFLILSIVFSISQKNKYSSYSIIDLGFYEMPDGTSKLIESPSSLMSDIKRNLIIENTQNIKLDNLYDRLIRIKTTSDSIEKNKKLILSYFNYVDTRHSKLSKTHYENEKQLIDNKINLAKSKITNLQSDLEAQNLSSFIQIEEKIERLKNDIPIIDREIEQLEDVIIADNKNLELIKNNDELYVQRASTSPTIDQVIFNYRSQINKLEKEKNKNIVELNTLQRNLELLKNFRSSELSVYKNELKFLEQQLEKHNNQILSKTKMVGDIVTETIRLDNKFVILIGLLIGLFTGIFLVFIINVVNKYRAL